MRASFYWLIVLALVGCASRPHAAPTPAGTPGPAAKVYFEGEGPDRDVKRFQKFLEIALDDYGMALADSSKDADATVKMKLSREEETEYLYTPLLWIDFNSREGADYTAKSCSSVSTSDSIFRDPIKVISSIEFPPDWKKHEELAVYVDESQVVGLKELIPVLKKTLNSSGHHIVNTHAEADVALASIKVQKLAVPMRTNVLHTGFEVFDRPGTRIYYTSGKGSTERTNLGPGPGIKLENIPCGSTMKTFWIDSSGSWQQARGIARTIREDLNKTPHSN